MTLLNGLAGFLAITYILDGKFVHASLLIILALVFDGLDGTIARRFGSSHHFGRFLDSISDSVSFCFAPALLVYANFYDAGLGSAWVNMPNAAAVITSMFIGAFGILRLARFSSKEYKHRYFIGFPTPAMALTTVIMCSLFGPLANNPVSYGPQLYPVLIFLTILAFLMVSDIPFPKMKGVFLHLSILTGTFVAFPLLIYQFEPAFCAECLRKMETLALIPLVAYLVVGPFYVLSRRKKSRIKVSR